MLCGGTRFHFITNLWTAADLTNGTKGVYMVPFMRRVLSLLLYLWPSSASFTSTPMEVERHDSQCESHLSPNQSLISHKKTCTCIMLLMIPNEVHSQTAGPNHSEGHLECRRIRVCTSDCFLWEPQDKTFEGLAFCPFYNFLRQTLLKGWMM